MLWNRKDEGGIPLCPGLHEFPFAFLLPPRIPSSFESSVGCVRYELYGRIVTSSVKFDRIVKIDIPVLEVVDINSNPLLRAPSCTQVHKRVWSAVCKFTDVRMSVKLPRVGFCVGEDIPLSITLGGERQSRDQISIMATLKQVITYAAKGNKTCYDKATVVQTKAGPSSSMVDGSVAAMARLKIPEEIATTQDFGLVNIAYSIKVVACVAWAQRLVCRIPIILGNIPFASDHESPSADLKLKNSPSVSPVKHFIFPPAFPLSDSC